VTTEAQLQEQITDLCRVTGWRSMHVRRSIGKGRKWTTATSVRGWPDLTLWDPRAGGLILVELKSEAGDLSAQQTEVICSLRAAGVDVRVWRPSDWPEIQATLTRSAS
jgi:hypothetical protein